VRDIAFGPICLRIEGELASAPWPRGALDVCVSARADAHIVRTELVDALPPLADPSIDAGAWRAAPHADGTRFAVVEPPERVVTDLHLGSTMFLRVVREFIGFDRALWFDILVQLAVAQMAPAYGGLALHAACVEVGGRAVLLCGRSGAGKTTLSGRLIRAGGRLLSHDRTVLFGNGAWRAVSTPWGHDGRLASAERERDVGAVLFLEQAPQNSSEPLSGARGIARVASVVLGARSAKAVMSKAMEVAERLVREVPCHVVRLTNDERATKHVLELLG
jgi:hypothetical protein